MKRITMLSLLSLALAAPPALASGDHKHGHGGHGDKKAAAPAAAAPAAAAGAMAEGEVRRVDKEQGKITLRHGEIKNLDMAPMTMVFKVKDPAMLDRVKQGDKVGFTAEKIGGEFTVTGIEPKK
jgi:Cu/Ag efflux protein CusF